MHLGRCFSWDHFDYLFEYQTERGERKNIKIQKIGIVICIKAKSLESWEFLLFSSPSLFSHSDIFLSSLLLCVEDWKEGLLPLLPFISQAFVKASMVKRIEYLNGLMEIKSHSVQEIFKLRKIRVFLYWMFNVEKCGNAENLKSVRKVIPNSADGIEQEIRKLNYLSRYKNYIYAEK